jgi:hypothetical protein
MSYALVVARYHEDMKWSEYVDKSKLVVYDKYPIPMENTIPRKNFGRDPETFLYYIMSNYDNLPDYTLFVQGFPFDQMKDVDASNFQDKIDKLIESKPETALPLFRDVYSEHISVHPGLLQREYYKYIFDTEDAPEIFMFSAGCQYIVPRHVIMVRPKHFYEKLHDMSYKGDLYTYDQIHFGKNTFNPDGISPWTMERLFGYIYSNLPIRESTFSNSSNECED